jgi:2-hydroxy-6-oxonona-2,4-dienedioate hydrolase
VKSLFKNEASKAVVLEWFEKFRARIPTATQSREVQTRFGLTHVLVGGPEDAPPLVLCHGAMASSAHALVELSALLERFRVYAVDVIGQSVKSADTRLSVKNDDYGHWLAEVMDGLSLKSAHVVGISWGGFVTIRLAAVAPERITKLALLVPAGMVSGSMWRGFVRMGWPMTKYLMAPSESRLHGLVENLLTTKGDEWTPFLGDAFRSYDVASMSVPRLAEPGELAKFTAPTLVMGADQDVSFPGERLLARAPELFKSLKETELIRGAMHCPPTTPAFRDWLSNRISSFLTPERAPSSR